MSKRFQLSIRAVVVTVLSGLFLSVLAAPSFGQEEPVDTAYQFICETGGAGLGAVDVLQATGDHNTFLELFGRYDPEGLAILADPELADKTVWAPTDAAFLAIGDSLASLSPEEIKAVLGYHISPPRRSPAGDYPIVTPQLLIDAGQMIHRTRTGVLTESDQRTRTTVTDGLLRIEDARIRGNAWCTEAGSVFSLDAVITDVTPPSLPVLVMNRTIQILFYDDIRFVIYSVVGATALGLIISGVVNAGMKRKKNAAPPG